MVLTEEPSVTVTTRGTGAIVATVPVIFGADVGLLKADIACSAILTFTALTAIAATGNAHIRVWIALKTFGARAEWATLFRAILHAAVGTAIGTTFFAETTRSGVAFLNTNAILGAVKATGTDTAHTTTTVVATLLTGTVRSADFANVDLRVLLGFHIADPAGRTGAA